MNSFSGPEAPISTVLDDVFTYLEVNTLYKPVNQMEPARNLNYDKIQEIEKELEDSGLTSMKEVEYQKTFKLNSRGVREMAKFKTYSSYLKGQKGGRVVSSRENSVSSGPARNWTVPLLTVLVSVVLSTLVSWLIFNYQAQQQAEMQYNIDKQQNSVLKNVMTNMGQMQRGQ